VLAQTFCDWEHIIVDDGSEDGSADLISELAASASRIRLITHERNLGPGCSRNSGVAAAEGRYIAYLDADDQWLPHKLERQLQAMRDNDWVFSYSDYAVIDQDDNLVRPSVGVPAVVDYDTLLKNTAIACLTVMIDTQRLQDLDMPDIPSGQDYALWFRILRQGTLAHGLADVLARYRVRPNSVSRNKLHAARRMWRLYREFEGLGLVRSSWCFAHYAVNSVKKRR